MGEFSNDTPDIELVKAIKNSNRQAFRIFFERHYQNIYRHTWHIIREDQAAYDLAQETFFKIWEKRTELNPGKSIKAFLQVISRNTAISWLRDPRNRHVSLDDKDYPVENPEEGTEELIRELHKVMKGLDEPLRIVLKLRLRGMKDREIADILGLSVKAVDKRKTKAFNIVREQLRPFLILGIFLNFLFFPVGMWRMNAY